MLQKEHLSSLIGSRVELIFTTGDKLMGTIEATDEYENILLTDVSVDNESFDRVLLSATKVTCYKVF
ncbi:Hypothetical protein GLP15_5236 [Giardia lamblia P15]|uniref:Sm domain-containing protein n=1 Tax=Giardia intestinalis (strain P15) TaxID=658858 RepID=E1EYN3_GIAIA|nr:Hypothetical protein GLP15_5236 [Giardia lamblia P15]